jgi:hypothetical protein
VPGGQVSSQQGMHAGGCAASKRFQASKHALQDPSSRTPADQVQAAAKGLGMPLSCSAAVTGGTGTMGGTRGAPQDDRWSWCIISSAATSTSVSVQNKIDAAVMGPLNARW